MIFVFSGTGNSYSVARRIADALGVGMVDLAAAVRYRRFGYDAGGEDVGFVFPTYYYGLPDMVAAMADNVTVRNPGRVFAVATCGEESGGACDMLAERLSGRLDVDACYDVVMPDNSIFAFEPPTPEQEAEVLESADAEVEAIIGSLRNGDSGDLRNHVGDKDWRELYPLYDQQRVTEPFAVTDRCIECRVCEEVCPQQIIRVYHRKPVWDEERCSLCMSCLELCPKQAIEYGESTVGRRRFFHRDYYEKSLGVKLRYRGPPPLSSCPGPVISGRTPAVGEIAGARLRNQNIQFQPDYWLNTVNILTSYTEFAISYTNR